MDTGNATDDRKLIRFPYGNRQVFRRRFQDINVVGRTSLRLPVRRSEWWLNEGRATHFYVERTTQPNEVKRYPWGTRTPAVNRLRDRPGSFNIEVAVDDVQLREGDNQLRIFIEGGDGQSAEADVILSWDPTSVELPVDLSELRTDATVQHVGQVVDGLWNVDQNSATITTCAPVGHDALFVLGGLHGSQEATYLVAFDEPIRGVFLGLSDFFVGHDAQEPGLGIKPGYSTAGLATLTPTGEAQCWLAMGDNTWDKLWPWVRRSRHACMPVVPRVTYRVRHQVVFDAGDVLSRFRMWPTIEKEPTHWQCSVDSVGVPVGMPRPAAAAFALFQYHGTPTRWWDVQVRSIDGRITSGDLIHRPLEETPQRVLAKVRPKIQGIGRRLRAVRGSAMRAG